MRSCESVVKELKELGFENYYEYDDTANHHLPYFSYSTEPKNTVRFCLMSDDVHGFVDMFYCRYKEGNEGFCYWDNPDIKWIETDITDISTMILLYGSSGIV